MHRETHAVGSKATKLWLQRRFYLDHAKAPGTQGLQEALGVLEARARFDGAERPVHVRVAEHEGTIYVDLANDDWEVVEITKEDWKVTADPPVRFRRPGGMAPLPLPVAGGDIGALKRFVNVDDEAGWKLLVSWLVQAFRPVGPFPALVLQGEQGSAKTTTARILKKIVDPSAVPLRTAPREERDLMLAANNSWVLALDNLSGLQPWLSDALCRLSTGGGFGTRTLYQNDEETLFVATRPVILNGITDVSTRADLLDRSIVLSLPSIPEEERRPESELWADFEKALPTILGTLFCATSTSLRELPNVELPALPRMADFALWATAAEAGLGWEPGAFMEAYGSSRKKTNEIALESDPVAVAVAKLMEARDEWVGTTAALLRELGKHVDDDGRRYKTWPKQPQHLSAKLKRIAPVLREEGIEVEDLPRKGTERKKRLFKKKPTNERHHRHERHDDPNAPTDAPCSGEGDDDGMTLTRDDEPEDRRSNGPVEIRDSARHDDDDAHDDETRRGSRAPLIANEEDARAITAEISRFDRVAIDLETTGLDPRKDRIRLFSLATEDGAWIVDCSRVDPSSLFSVLSEKTLVVHNAMHDLLFLRHLGYRHRGRAVDTMTLSRMAHAGERAAGNKRLAHTLEACCERELGLELDKTHQKADWSGDITPEMLDYASGDARVLLPLGETLEKKLRESGQKRAVEIEERALLSAIEMAHNGVPVDKERWLTIVEEAGERLGELLANLDGLVGNPPEEVRQRNAKNKNVIAERKDRWNWDSPDQIKAAAETVGLSITETSMDRLRLVDHDLARALLAYREAKSGLATFGEKFFEPTEDGREVYLEGRLYPSWGMCAADTGRMSCASPNVQNVPNKSRLGSLRGCVTAPEDHLLVKADYSQIELRIVAKVAGEEAMLEAYRNGEDLHARTARSITGHEEITKGDRQLAKAVNFGLLYGQGANGLRNYARDKYGIEMSSEKAAEYRERWFAAYPAIRAWHRGEGADFDSGEDCASTLAGRMRRVGSFMEKVNHPVQGTGADGLKLAMAFFHERRPNHLDAKLILAVHDELVVECPEGQAEEAAGFLKKVMVEGMDEVLNPGVDADHTHRVPVEVDVEMVESWGG